MERQNPSSVNAEKPKVDWDAVYTGNLFEVQQNDRGWEKVARAPGVRIIIDDQVAGKLLLTREYRSELGDYDFRLPGGKVFDSLDEFRGFRATGDDILNPAIEKAIQESHEETGYDIQNPELIDISKLGATVEWDLYVFAATEFSERADGQNLEEGEDISVGWYSYDDVQKMVLRGDMQEDRVAMILFRYLYQKEGGRL